MTEIKLKRVYDDPQENDGYRILIDRLWPRGVKKEDLPYDLWNKEITPSNDLRKWFDHDPDKFNQFKSAYKEELIKNEETAGFAETIKEELVEQDVTLLYSAKDKEYNHAIILKEFLNEQVKF